MKHTKNASQMKKTTNPPKAKVERHIEVNQENQPSFWSSFWSTIYSLFCRFIDLDSSIISQPEEQDNQPEEYDIQPRDFWYVNQIGIEKGRYAGECEEAISKISAFCKNNNVSIHSSGYGYGSVNINGVRHGYNPYGIDIEMMLEWCNIKMPLNKKNSARQPAQTSSAKDPIVVSYKNKTRDPKKATPPQRDSHERACKTKALRLIAK